ncbi:MAG: DUF1549 and DUF1553 domain-containing protein [Planctomycetes bacterium]|nr:DUF1549 and DUF1553 domain-containing protein [Planctomycetota bacterium]
MRLRLLLTAAICTLAANIVSADDLAPASKPIPQVIDQYIDAAIAEAGATPAGQADDATLIRRLTLDLVGRIPTTTEVDEYVKSKDSDKRTKLVDRLIASPGFARHQAALFEAMFNPDGNGRGSSGGFRQYMTDAVRENKPWDKIFREVVLADETDAKLKGAAEFIKGRVNDADKLTNDVSVAFFGVNVSCAQCHNHPLVMDWTQDHFYGMKMFLARTFENGGFLGERGYGTIKYKPTKGAERTAKMMFLTGTVIEESSKEPTPAEMKQEKEALDKAKTAKTAPPAPKFSARGKLVEVALKDANADFFAKNIVNRMWHRYFAAGLVNPLDQMHSENRPTHPELLSWLARDVAANGYDLKRLTRGLVLSKAYSRSSKYESSLPDSKLFAVAKLKPMTPNQLATSLKIAATDPASFEGKKPEELEKLLEQAENAGRGFASLISQPTDNFQIGVGEALLFSNGDRIMREFLTDGGGSALGRVKLMKEPKEAAEFLVKTAYGRPATAEEVKAITAYVEKRQGREAEAYRQVMWALVTSPEFRFSY